jgi:hypothetical protein
MARRGDGIYQRGRGEGLGGPPPYDAGHPESRKGVRIPLEI